MNQMMNCLMSSMDGSDVHKYKGHLLGHQQTIYEPEQIVLKQTINIFVVQKVLKISIDMRGT